MFLFSFASCCVRGAAQAPGIQARAKWGRAGEGGTELWFLFSCVQLLGAQMSSQNGPLWKAQGLEV